jgi:hypothetical protein
MTLDVLVRSHEIQFQLSFIFSLHAASVAFDWADSCCRRLAVVATIKASWKENKSAAEMPFNEQAKVSHARERRRVREYKMKREREREERDREYNESERERERESDTERDREYNESESEFRLERKNLSMHVDMF